MDHNDHVNLLRPADLQQGGSWADLGAGSGAFTFALRELIGASAVLHAVDKDRNDLNRLKKDYEVRFGNTENLKIVVGDFSRPLAAPLPPLDGIVMANSLHYFKDRVKILEHVRSLLNPNGILLVVEYNVDTGNLWVPYPFSFETFKKLAIQAGFGKPRLLAKHPSSFLREFYSASTQNQT
ncbi:MAG: class I SAM-dependent methyltransferase [Anaerolineales bacterium]|nr:class I SAM-dependent methyltransferase [Anaerolineales bacterium]